MVKRDKRPKLEKTKVESAEFDLQKEMTNSGLKKIQFMRLICKNFNDFWKRGSDGKTTPFRRLFVKYGGKIV